MKAHLRHKNKVYERLELPEEVAKWLWACTWLPVPEEPLLGHTPRQAFAAAAERWPVRVFFWLSANPQIRGIEFTNTAGKRVQRRWNELNLPN